MFIFIYRFLSEAERYCRLLSTSLSWVILLELMLLSGRTCVEPFSEPFPALGCGRPLWQCAELGTSWVFSFECAMSGLILRTEVHLLSMFVVVWRVECHQRSGGQILQLE